MARVAQRAAENDVARKSKFLRYLFHEIRVPLTSLILGVDSLKNLLPEDLDSVLACNTLTHSDASDSTCKTSRRDGLVSYSQSGGQIKTLVDMMATSTGHMSRILNDTLSLEKMREGKLSLVEESFHVRDLIDDALFMLGPSIEDKHLNVVKIEQTNLPRMVGDTCRIKQVIANFMTNAIKFSSEYNTITVTAQVVPGGYTHPRMFLPVFSPPVSNRRLGSSSISSSGSSSGEQKRTCNLCVTIRDNGVGISDENQKRLFQPFVQINPHELQQGEGSGLGLSICKRIVEMYNGDVGVYSELSVGSEFYFIIPLEITETEDPQPLSILPSTSSSVGERKTDSGPFPLDVLLKGHGGNISAKVKGAAAGSSSSSSPTSPPQRKRKKKRTTKKNRRRLSGKASSKNSGDSLAAKLKGVQVMVCDDIGSIRKLLSMSLRRNGMIVHEAKDGNECVEFFCQNSLDRGVKGSENNGTLESEGYDDTVGVTTRNMRQRKRQQRSLIHTPANTVSNADDGGGGIAQQAREVRLLFIDMEMPVMNGPEAIRLLRDGGLRIPIIGLTGNVLDMDQHAFLDAGANMVLNKPVQPDTLLQLILKHVEEDE